MSEQCKSRQISHRFKAKQSWLWGCFAGAADGKVCKEHPFEGSWCKGYPKPIT